MSMIEKPGIYTDIPGEAYFSDPCPMPSLTQSIAKLLIDKSPLHAWYAHSRLNPSYQQDGDTKFSMGNCAHLLLLGRGKNIEVVSADDWRKKEAREQRDAAIAAGNTPVLAEQYERAYQMTNAARLQLANMGITLPGVGASEVVLAWKEGFEWFRSMIDWLSAEGLVVLDYKTTLASAAPHAIPTKMAADGWCIQAAFHERGLNVLAPQNAGRRRHMFACQEETEPYAMTICEIPESAMTMGRKQVQYAVNLWGACLRKYGPTGAWPGYGNTVIRPEYPTWAESKWLEREIEESQNERAA